MDAKDLIERDLSRKLGDFYTNLSKVDLKRIKRNIEQLRDDGDNRLTDTEEQEIARMMYFVDKIGALINEKGMDGVDPTLISTMVTYEKMILDTLRKTRETGERPPSLVDELNQMTADVANKDGKIIIKMKDGDEE